MPALRALGLVDVRGRLQQAWNPPGPMWTAYRHSLRRLRDRLVATGRINADELDRLDDLLGDPAGQVTFVSGGVVSAWGRRPSS